MSYLRSPNKLSVCLQLLVGSIWLIFLGGGCTLFDNSGPVPVSTSFEEAHTPQPLESKTPVATYSPQAAGALDTITQTPTAEELTPFIPMDFSAPDCSYGGQFRSIEAPQRYEVVFSLCNPDPAFLAKIAFPTFSIYPKEFLESAAGGGGTQSLLLVKPVGTGPYLVDEWVQGEQLVFTAFDRYWDGEKSHNQILVFQWDLDEVQRLLELQAGLVDGVDNISSADFSTVREDPNLTLVMRPALNVFYLGINNTSAPLDDENVRRAIAMGIDKQKIVEELFPEGYETATFFTPCAIPNGCAGDAWYRFEPGLAREILAEAGYPNGFQTKLIYQDVVRGYLPRPGLVAAAIREQLRENLGIMVQLEEMSTLYYESLDAGLLPGLHLLGWGADYADITDFLDVHFGAQATGQFGTQHADIVTLLEQGGALFGDDLRRPFYEAANNAIRQHVPMVPIAQGGWVSPDELAVAFTQEIQGAHASPFGLEDFSSILSPGKEFFTWLQSVEPISLYCADETDSGSLRACSQVAEPLYRYEIGDLKTQPALAEICEPNRELTEWRCKIREGVEFHDGSTLNAADVVYSFLVQWDAAHPAHVGNSGEFHYFRAFWGSLLNE